MTARPRRIQLRRSKGWRLPPNTVVVARPSRWGNPFRIDARTTRAEADARYRAFALGPEGRSLREAAQRELKGAHLACWCPPGEPCHADVLLELANG